MPTEKLTFLVTEMDGMDPVHEHRICLGDIPTAFGRLSLSNIRWARPKRGKWRRRQERYVGSDLIVVDVDAGPRDDRPEWLGPVDEAVLRETFDRHGLKGFILRGRRPGNYLIVIVPERAMTNLEEHKATHQFYCYLLDGDRACCDGVDYYRERVVANNPKSGEVVTCQMFGQGARVWVKAELQTTKNAVLPLDIMNTKDKLISHYQFVTQVVDSSSSSVAVDSINLDGTIRYLQSASPAISGQGGETTLFNAMVAAGRMLHRYDRVDLLADLVWQHYNPRCLPPWSKSKIEHNVTIIIEYATRWPRSPVPVAAPRWVKSPTMPCACGCSRPVEQQQGQGRQKKWATPGCAKRVQRAKAKIRTIEGHSEEEVAVPPLEEDAVSPVK